MKSNFFATTAGIVATGAVIGILAVVLQLNGNPPNMGICVACFERDMAGALGLHRAAIVQYLRPEIIGLVLGSLCAALAFGNFRARGGSSPITRFMLGIIAAMGALVFLGCPWRAVLRLARRGPQRPSWSGRPVHGNRRGNAVLPPGLFTRPQRSAVHADWLALSVAHAVSACPVSVLSAD